MENTYTFVARNANDPRQVVTLTLHNHHLSVGSGPPLEQVARATAEGESRRLRSRLWLRPLAISLAQRGTQPFPISDVFAEVEGDKLALKAWIRAARLRAFPLTLVNGPVDNPEAAHDFVEELQMRKGELALPIGFMELLDYWATWILAGLAAIGALVLWRRRSRSA